MRKEIQCSGRCCCWKELIFLAFQPLVTWMRRRTWANQAPPQTFLAGLQLKKRDLIKASTLWQHCAVLRFCKQLNNNCHASKTHRAVQVKHLRWAMGGHPTSEGSWGCKYFELAQRNLKKDLIKISTLTLSSVAVLQAALQLPLQQDSQSRPEVKHWDWHPTARSSWDTILWSKRTDVSIQYRGREVVYCILYKETSNCREMEYFWARDPAEHKMWCFYPTHTGSNIGDKLQKGAILWSLHSSPVVPHTLMENCRRERHNRRLQY